MKIEALKRTFAYNAIQLADPGAALTPAQVKDFYCAVYPDLTNAEIEGPKVDGNTHAYTFRRAVGTKGNFPAQARAAIDRYVGRDSLTIRPSQARAAEMAAHLTREVASTGRYIDRRRSASLPAPSTLLPLLP